MSKLIKQDELKNVECPRCFLHFMTPELAARLSAQPVDPTMPVEPQAVYITEGNRSASKKEIEK